ncbi:hypothetical protein GCM10009798_13040 [Nocardioides panacihumi]|uniref:N-acetyltransferase domain-containing protein n=1 Tax=Nocardioides panacihumi TaxID=400774 RepID=A0ABN2QPW7_9ACTN
MSESRLTPQPTLRPAVLIDSNLFIAAEDNPEGHVYGAEAAELVRLVPEVGFQLLLSQGTRSDILQAPPAVRERRHRQLAKYTVLAAAPVNQSVREQFPAVLTSNNSADIEVLNTFATGRARWLVTEDAQMRGRAIRAGLDGVLSLTEALDFLHSLKSPATVHGPAVYEVEGYQVQLGASIFDSLRADYEGFDDWWRDKVSNRPVIVLGDTEDPQGVGVLKAETAPYGLTGDLLKICTFKVAERVQGDKRGELLLRACLDHARQHRLDGCYLEVLPDKQELLAWLAAFGFTVLPGAATVRGEHVLVKHLHPPADTQADVSPADPLSPLAHHIAYGPGSLLLERAHVVPIVDHWLNQLMPDVTGGDLFTGTEGCGNAIRKAYLCHAPTNKLAPGDALLFMRTGAGPSNVCAVGVVEATRRSSEPDDIIAFVGTRTVYSRASIEAQCATHPVLAVLFRHDGPLPHPILISDLVSAGVLNGTPQSITEVSPEGVAWLRQRSQTSDE